MAETKNVLLGITDEKIPQCNIAYNVNKIGGVPDWPTVSRELPKCSLCGQLQLLVTQVYCPFDKSPCHRVLYVFCCKNPSCWSRAEGWSVCRITFIDNDLKHESMTTHPEAESFTNSAWGDDDNDWGEGDCSSCGDNKDIDINNESTVNMALCDVDCVTDQLTSVKIADDSTPGLSKVHNGLANAEKTITFESFYINVFDEAECKKWASSLKKSMEPKADEEFSDDTDYVKFAEGCKMKPEAYEKSEVGCRMFHKFWKRNQICPEQIIRYCYDGDPLLTRAVKKDIPNCHCGAKRVYEMQLMPALLPYLVLENVAIEFSTVLIYTCSKSCVSPEGFIQEYVVYQDDPDLSYFKGQKR